MAEIKNLRKKTIFELKEQLLRQKEILKSLKFIDKLPDKGEKLKTAIINLEEELKKRKEEPAPLSSVEMARVAKLEWSVGKNQPKELDSDDESEEEAEEMTLENSLPSSLQQHENDDPLRLVATSQISQNQPKIVSLPPEDFSRNAPSPQSAGLALRMTRLALNKPGASENFTFKPSRDHVKPIKPSSEEGSIFSPGSNNSGPAKYYESLFPLKTLENPPLKVLSLEESIQSEHEQQQKYQESINSQASKEPRKLYAYDELLQHGKIPMTTFEIFQGEKNEYLNALRDVPLDGCVDVSEEEGHISEGSETDDEDDE